jgi:cell division protein FtsI (penicillin-binding protein 3)
MSKFKYDKVIPRYTLFVVLMVLVAIAIICKAGYTMSAKRSYWLEVGSRLKVDSAIVSPVRGNILSCDGQPMASSLPEYRIYLDFKAMSLSKTDTLWDAKEDSICTGLHSVFPERSVEQFRKGLREAKKKQARHYALWPRRINYNVFTSVKRLPIFCLDKNKGGFHYDEFNARKRPYGSAAARTIGDMFGAKDTARCGLELSYDSLLRGKNGIEHRRKVLGKYLSIVDAPAINGADLVTTIDVGMQDIAERALVEKLKDPQVNGELGVAILMEVKTGDIKAIVNMTKCDDGEYREVMNSAINYRCEPGSVFKPASIMVALDDGVCDTSQIIHTGSGVMEMHSRLMKDHNWRTQGGYQDINVARSLEVSSNIGVSWIIDHYYGKNPEKYIDGLYRVGMHEDLHLPLVGYNPPVIRYPKRNPSGGVEDKTMIPWMSIGYNTQIAPINTLTFYNAIANDGTMVKPRFVKSVVKDGVTIAEYPVEVLKEHICKATTVKTMQTILRHVVSQGLGKKAGSRLFHVSGKTGTAQVSQGKSGYKSGTTGYWLSFAGYFPSEQPRYSCIVCIKKWGLPASGGGMSGVVFRKIAEGVMARDLKLDVTDAHEDYSDPVPSVLRGNILAADYVLSHLGFKCRDGWNGSYASGNPIWGTGTKSSANAVALRRERQYGKSSVPDVTGMGARDAVYLLESRGVKVKIVGRGKVTKQSLAPGTKIRKGSTCIITLTV